MSSITAALGLSQLDKIEKIIDMRRKNAKYYQSKLKKIKESFCSESLSDEETKSVIKEVYKNQKMLIDPHTAVAIGAVNKISLEGNTIILATAHPSKFSDVVMKETGIKPELPENLKNILIK